MARRPRRYQRHHEAERRRLAPFVASGKAICSRCGKVIAKGEPWDLDHAEGGGDGEYLGPSHRRCNRAHLLRKTQARRRGSREW
jgi:hypothetical protein